MIYLDTSALVQLYYKEPDSHWIRRAAARAPALVTAALTYAEIFAALNRKFLEGLMDLQQYRALAEQFDADWADWEVVPLSDEVLRIARRVVERHHLRAGDAVQLASALTVTSAMAAASRPNP